MRDFEGDNLSTVTDDNVKIAILGAGALGSLFGGILTAGGLNVTLIDPWEEHIDAIKKRGLQVIAEEGERTLPVQAVTAPAECDKMDIVIVLTKSNFTEVAIRQATNLFDENTVAISFQNGLGNEECIENVIGIGNVLGGQTSQGAAVVAPGIVRKAGHNPSIFGEMKGGISRRVKAIEKTFSDAGLFAIASENIRKDMWKKVLANLGVSPISAVCRMRVGYLFDIPEIEKLVMELLKEGVSVAKATGIDIAVDDGLELLHRVVYKEENKAKSNRSGMLVDIIAKRQTEIDYINGAVVNLGKKHNIPTPVNTAMVALVKNIEARFDRD